MHTRFRRPVRSNVPALPAASSSRAPRRLALVVAAACVMLTAAGAAPAPTRAANTHRVDLYFAAGYERQIDSRTCTAAAVAMMLNFIARRDLNLGQMFILRWEQPRDALANSVQRGSDPLGWARAATYFSSRTGKPTVYAWEAYGSARSALHRAAERIAKTAKPVGLLVAHGTHAMVMTGFEASDNPGVTDSYRLYSIIASDPYGAAHRAYDARMSPLNAYTQTDATPWYDSQWYGRYIVIAPQG